MKVLYIGSKAEEAASLNLEREITDLQRRFGDALGEPVSFTFLPRVLAEELAITLSKHKPDILHISAHGTTNVLALANEAGDEVLLTATALRAYLGVDRPPRLVYLNACNSHEIAQALSDLVPMVIGITQPITNRAARSGAAAFYGSLLDGASVARAFEVANHTIATLQAGGTSAALHVRGGIEPNSEYMHRVPRLVADFQDGIPRLQKGRYLIRAGVVGCPSNTVQLIVFTDDASFVEDYDPEDTDDDLASHLCFVVRRTPAKGALWIAEGDNWWVSGDFRLFATGVTGDGSTFTVQATLVSEAIELRYRLAPGHDVPDDVALALTDMRRNDGAELDYAPKRRQLQGAAGVTRASSLPSTQSRAASTTAVSGRSTK